METKGYGVSNKLLAGKTEEFVVDTPDAHGNDEDDEQREGGGEQQ